MNLCKARKLRKYEPIWLHIKANGLAVVNYDGSAKLRERIIKAVIKEKDMDTELKEISPKTLWIERKNSQIIFHLVEKR